MRREVAEGTGGKARAGHRPGLHHLGVFEKPEPAAAAAASARVRTPSLRRIAETWWSTVRVETTSSSAISALRFPAATRRARRPPRVRPAGFARVAGAGPAGRRRRLAQPLPDPARRARREPLELGERREQRVLVAASASARAASYGHPRRSTRPRRRGRAVELEPVRLGDPLGPPRRARPPPCQYASSPANQRCRFSSASGIRGRGLGGRRSRSPRAMRPRRGRRGRGRAAGDARPAARARAPRRGPPRRRDRRARAHAAERDSALIRLIGPALCASTSCASAAPRPSGRGTRRRERATTANRSGQMSCSSANAMLAEVLLRRSSSYISPRPLPSIAKADPIPSSIPSRGDFQALEEAVDPALDLARHDVRGADHVEPERERSRSSKRCASSTAFSPQLDAVRVVAARASARTPGPRRRCELGASASASSSSIAARLACLGLAFRRR